MLGNVQVCLVGAWDQPLCDCYMHCTCNTREQVWVVISKRAGYQWACCRLICCLRKKRGNWYDELYWKTVVDKPAQLIVVCMVQRSLGN